MTKANVFEVVQDFDGWYRVADNGCWEWDRPTQRQNYGYVWVRQKYWLAHRLMYFIVNGELPDAVRHTCDNPPCVNPEHLLPGTVGDNNRDRHERGRSWVKHDDDTVRAIFKDRRELGLSQEALGKKYGYSQTMIGMILRRQYRGNVEI